jgi:uncharacterized Zn finger protein
LLGEQLDQDPFLLFRLRGRDQAALLAGLKPSVSGVASAEPEAAIALGEPLTLDGNYAANAPIPTLGEAPEGPELALLRRLGPFAPLDADLIALLGPLYRAVAVAAGERPNAGDVEDVPTSTVEP